jgi:hypothetical protein
MTWRASHARGLSLCLRARVRVLWPRPRTVVVVVVAAVSASGGCDVRTALAQEAVFASLRPGLVRECCACLVARGTGHPEATCTEAVLVDGETTVPDGAMFGSGDQTLDDNDVLDAGEIPCMCGGLDEGQCAEMLSRPEGRLIIPGACIDQVDRTAPCEEACGGVLAFVPLQG